MESESNPATTEPEKDRTAMTVRLDTDLWMRFRIVLLRERKTMQGIFEDYVRRYVEAKEKK
jgi:hypothetical protein